MVRREGFEPTPLFFFGVRVGPLAGVQLGVDGELEPQTKLDRWGKTCPTPLWGWGGGGPERGGWVIGGNDWGGGAYDGAQGGV